MHTQQTILAFFGHKQPDIDRYQKSRAMHFDDEIPDKDFPVQQNFCRSHQYQQGILKGEVSLYH